MSDDVTDLFIGKTQKAATSRDSAEMNEWAASLQSAGDVLSSDQSSELPAGSKLGKALPVVKPLRRATDDSMGRPKAESESTAGTIMRNVAEVPGAALRGVHDAVTNAVGGASKLAKSDAGKQMTQVSPLTMAIPNALAAVDSLAGWLDENVADLRYNVKVNPILHDPKTTTGVIVQETAKFLTGFIPALGVVKAAGIGGAAAPMVAGAVSDFVVRDGAEARLSDWWKKAGLPGSDLVGWLANNEGDSELDGRMKNAIEGLALGGMADGVFRAVKAIKAAKPVAGAVADEAAFLKGRYGEVTHEHITATGLGDLDRPAVEVGRSKHPTPNLDPRTLIKGKVAEAPLAGHKTTELGDVIVNESAKEPSKFQVTFFDGKAEKGAIPTQDHVYGSRAEAIKAFEEAGQGKVHEQSWGGVARSEDFDVYINFSRFDSQDDVKFAIGKMADAAKGSITEATRGKIAQAETQKMANELGMSVADLLARRKGQGFNAEEAVAARQLWAASGDKLVELAKRAASADASPLDHFAFRKMMATHSAIQAEVIGARTETARALASWAMPVKGGNVERARIVDQVLQSTGGVDTSRNMALRLAMLADAGADAGTIGRFAFKGYGAATVDGLKELWINGLLSSPKTHVVNVTANALTAVQSIYERQVAGLINAAAGGGTDGVQMGEALAMAHGLIGGIRDSFRLAAQYLKTGESKFNFAKVDITKPDAISAEAFNISQSSSVGRFVDFMGKVIGTPMHVLGAEDEFFKSIGYRMEVRAQALRTATAEGHTGKELAARVQALTDSPTEAIRINAADAALYQTFTNEMGAFGKGILNLRNIDHPLNPSLLIMPFVRTPVNIARYAFERTPFAPLVSQWRADIAAGGARADLALARMSTGTAIMLTAMDMADRGLISGGGPQSGDGAAKDALVRQGWKPYSVKVGDQWFSYDRLDPVGMTMGFAASISESIKKGEIDQDDVDEWQEVAAMTVAAVSQVAISKTYLEGLSKFVGLMNEPKQKSEQYIKDMFASFLPATSLNSTVKNMIDPVQRESGSPAEAVYARIAGLSEKLPPRRDLWGKEMTNSSGYGAVYDALSPVASKPIIDSPIDKEIVRLEDGPAKIAKKNIFDGVAVNMKKYPEVYDEYVKLAGNELKHPGWGMGAKDYLDAVVSGGHPMSAVYATMSDESRTSFIKNAVRDYRQLAQRQILSDPRFSAFASEVSYLKNHRVEAKMPIMGE